MISLYKGLNMAISMFTVIPLPKYEWDDKSAKHMMKLYPVIGLIVGSLWYVAFLILNKLNISLMLTSALLMAVPFMLTGFLHLDGFMDVCDALLSRRPKDEKLRILKDSTVGAFSVISLAILFIIEFAAINTLLIEEKNPLFLILIPIISRSLVGYFLLTRDTISESYLGNLFKQGTGSLDKAILIGIYLATFILCYIISDLESLIIPVIMWITSYVLVNKSKKELGGINGDVAGYMLVLSECIGLIVLGII